MILLPTDVPDATTIQNLPTNDKTKIPKHLFNYLIDNWTDLYDMQTHINTCTKSIQWAGFKKSIKKYVNNKFKENIAKEIYPFTKLQEYLVCSNLTFGNLKNDSGTFLFNSKATCCCYDVRCSYVYIIYKLSIHYI